MSEQAEAPKGTVPEDANEHCVGPESEKAGKASGCEGCPNQEACATGPKGPDPDMEAIKRRMRDIKHKILVLSGKGGVGKSTFAAQLAFALAAKDKDVGLLDIDICGPSMPKMLGLEGQEIHQSNMGWSPVYVDVPEGNLGVMSIGFMLPNADDPVIWRGPRKNGLIKQFMKDVNWGEIDYLVIDSPPGTSDEHISVAQFLKDCDVDGALVVTTPQEVSIIDVRKEINFCKKVGLPILGVVENMSGMRQRLGDFKFMRGDGPGGAERDATAEILDQLRRTAPDLLDIVACTDVFHASGGGAAAMAADMGVPFLGRVPLDAALSRAGEEGRSAFQLESPEEIMDGSSGGGGNKKVVGKAGAGALPALQNIIDQVIAAAEGRVMQSNGVSVANGGAFDLGTIPMSS